ncbi:MAG: HNH endonuclease [Pseudomonadota bacterium]
MNFKKLSDPKAVLAAVAECDELGRETFLSRYGFGKARTFFLRHEGKTYDSKAILGVAFKHQFGKALTATDFSGGQKTVVLKLAELGFHVVALELNERTAAFAEEVPDSIWEGARRTITVNAFERSPYARAACIDKHGSSCAICQFNFAKEFGPELQGFIHVHHVVPLSKIGKRYKVDPEMDLLPVCPNCHAVLHYGGQHRTPEQVQAMRKKA